MTIIINEMRLRLDSITFTENGFLLSSVEIASSNMFIYLSFARVVVMIVVAHDDDILVCVGAGSTPRFPAPPPSFIMTWPLFIQRVTTNG